MHIFVRAHTIYDVFVLIGHAFLKIAHNTQWPSHVTASPQIFGKVDLLPIANNGKEKKVAQKI